LPQPPKRVLCVEDNEDISFLLYTVLKREGYDAVTTYTVGDALMLAGREDFDLYILDVTFERGSGLDLCRALREARPDTPVVFYSAAAFDSDREAALRAGACAYVTKPGIEELVEAVRRALDAG
jgi:DNA-binding response OmpR family regulator